MVFDFIFKLVLRFSVVYVYESSFGCFVMHFVLIEVYKLYLAFTVYSWKCRQLVGEEASSLSGKFTFLNRLDMGSGTVACGVKEGVKLYF